MNVISHVLVLVYYNTVVLSKNQIIQYILCQQDSYPRGDGWETIICLNTVTFLCLSQSMTYISNVIWCILFCVQLLLVLLILVELLTITV
jgi:hypothetical protein